MNPKIEDNAVINRVRLQPSISPYLSTQSSASAGMEQPQVPGADHTPAFTSSTDDSGKDSIDKLSSILPGSLGSNRAVSVQQDQIPTLPANTNLQASIIDGVRAGIGDASSCDHLRSADPRTSFQAEREAMSAIAQYASADVADDEEFEDNHEEVVVESPDGRWHRRDEIPTTKGLKGVDKTYLAIDTEEGVEVVWNEIDILTNGDPTVLTKIDRFFDNLVKIDHQNVVKFYGHWVECPDLFHIRVFFITEHMPTGSLKAFLKKTKKTQQALSPQSWKRWCVQLLSALDYLHSRNPPIVYGSLTTEAILIQNNGILKIGSFSLSQLQTYAKGLPASEIMSSSFTGPVTSSTSVETDPTISNAVDIYMFGIVALEMLNLDVNLKLSNGLLDQESLLHAISILGFPEQDFIRSCLLATPENHPSARQLLHHPVVFAIYSLRLLCAHQLVCYLKNRFVTLSEPNDHIQDGSSKINVQIQNKIDEFVERLSPVNKVAVLLINGKPVITPHSCKVASTRQDLCNFLEDVRVGHYPLASYERSEVGESTTALRSDLSDCCERRDSGGASQTLSCLIPSEESCERPMAMSQNAKELRDPVKQQCMGIKGDQRSELTTAAAIPCTGSKSNGPQTSALPASQCESNRLVASGLTSVTNNKRSLISAKQNEQPIDPEYRRIGDVQICKIEKLETNKMQLSIQLDLVDREENQEHMRRNLTTIVHQNETSKDIADELIRYGFINQVDMLRIIDSIESAMSDYRTSQLKSVSTLATSTNPHGDNAVGSSTQTNRLLLRHVQPSIPLRGQSNNAERENTQLESEAVLATTEKLSSTQLEICESPRDYSQPSARPAMLECSDHATVAPRNSDLGRSSEDWSNRDRLIKQSKRRSLAAESGGLTIKGFELLNSNVYNSMQTNPSLVADVAPNTSCAVPQSSAALREQAKISSQYVQDATDAIQMRTDTDRSRLQTGNKQHEPAETVNR